MADRELGAPGPPTKEGWVASSGGDDRVTLAWTPGMDTLLALALEEDLGRGDATTAATVPPGTLASGVILAKEALVLCGMPVVERVFARVSPAVEVSPCAAD